MFDKILKEVILPNEGGYVNNPNDRGGATNFGITQRTYDKYRENNGWDKQDVKLIQQREVTEIYFSFWTKARCDLLFDYAPALTVQHFDFLVNSGYERKGTDAAEILQRTINIQIPTTIDGYIGPKTLGNIIAYIRQYPLVGDKNLWADYCSERNAYYRSIINNNPSQSVFLKGWLNRIEKTNSWIRSNIFGNKL